MIKSIVIACLCGFSAVSFAQSPPAGVLDAQKGFQEVLLGCPDRIWRGIDWSQTQMLLVSSQANQSWLIAPGAAAPELVPLAGFPPAVTHAAFFFFDFRGKTTITVNLDLPWIAGGQVSPFDLAVHELFHHVGQKDWRHEVAPRGTLVPLEARPRYLRAMLLRELQRAGQGAAATVAGQDQADARAAAAFWYRAWKAEFPAEYAARSDGYEGTARYVELRARQFLKLGCAATDSEIAADTAEWARGLGLDPRSGLDAEGYDAGALAGAILDVNGISWQDEAKTGRTAIDILDANESLVPARADDSALLARDTQLLAEQNARIDLWRLPLEAKLADPAYVRLNVPSAWIQGSFAPMGFFIPRAAPDTTYIPWALRQVFSDLTDGTIDVRAASVAVSERAGLSPCGESAWVMLVARDQIHEDRGTFRGRDGDTEFVVKGRMVKSDDGFAYLCPGRAHLEPIGAGSVWPLDSGLHAWHEAHYRQSVSRKQ